MTTKKFPQSTENQHNRHWGTKYDYEDKVPTQYSGISFDQAWHDDIERFYKLSNKEKWEMGYWVERQAIKKSFRGGVITGIIIGIFIAYIIITLSMVL